MLKDAPVLAGKTWPRLPNIADQPLQIYPIKFIRLLFPLVPVETPASKLGPGSLIRLAEEEAVHLFFIFLTLWYFLVAYKNLSATFCHKTVLGASAAFLISYLD
jgi:hypothetical protein